VIFWILQLYSEDQPWTQSSFYSWTLEISKEQVRNQLIRKRLRDVVTCACERLRRTRANSVINILDLLVQHIVSIDQMYCMTNANNFTM